MMLCFSTFAASERDWHNIQQKLSICRIFVGNISEKRKESLIGVTWYKETENDYLNIHFT